MGKFHDIGAARLLAHVGGKGEGNGGKELLHAVVCVCGGGGGGGGEGCGIGDALLRALICITL